MWAEGEVVLGIYEVREVIRAGGMGLVYRVWHRGWGVDLAVKTPRPEMASDGLAGFEAEADAWVRLGAHPNVVNCVYVRRVEDLPRVFAEWVAGGTLADAVRDRRLYRGGHRVALARLLDIAAQVARGLDHAHRHGLVHQDVKPANVMMEADGTAKVTDFGLARARTARTGAVTDPLVTFAGMTLAYCSPEQARGERLGVATDVWSWAVSVLEMFAGQPPSYFGQAAGRVFEQFVAEGTEGQVIPRLPEALAEMLRRCFTVDPAARPGSLGEVAEELARIYCDTTGEPYPREPPSEAQLLADGLSNQALSLLDLGDPDQADRLWDRALRAEPRHPHATFNRSLRRWRAGLMTDRAVIAELDAVRTSQGGFERGTYLLALVHLERGDKGSATRLLGDLQDSPDVLAARAEADRLPPARPPVVLQPLEPLRLPAFAVSADGHLAVVSYGTCDLLVWDLDALTPLYVLSGHTASPTSVALSADGRILVSADDRGHVRLWDTAAGSCRQRWDLPHSVELVAISGDARVVAVSGMDGSVRLLGDTVRLIGQPFEKYGPGFGAALTVVANGERVAAFDGYRWLLRVWDVRTGTLVTSLSNLHQRFAFSSGGQFALTIDEEPVARLVDLTTGKVRALGNVAGWGLGSPAVSSDARTALASDGSGLQKWLLDGARCQFTAYDTTGDVAASADGRVALVSDRELVVVWPPPPGPSAPWSYARPRMAFHLIEDARTVEASLDRAASLLAKGRAAEAWDHLQTVRTLPGYRRHPRLLPLWRRAGAADRRASFAGAWRTRTFRRLLRGPAAFTPDLRHAISGSYFGVVTVHDLRTGHVVELADGHNAEVQQTAMCADGRHAITTDIHGIQIVWDLPTARKVTTLRTSDGTPERLDPPEGPLALTRRKRSRPALLWERSTRLPLHAWCDPRHRAVTLSGNVLVTVADDGRSRVLDLRNGRRLRTMRLPSSVASVATSTDGRVVITAGGSYADRGVIGLSHVHLGMGEQTISDESVSSLALTPEGDLLLTGSGHEVRLWDVRTGDLLCDLEGGHTTTVFGVALSADGCHAVSADVDGTVQCWDVDWEYTRPPQ